MRYEACVNPSLEHSSGAAKSEATNPPVLILGTGITALGVIRSLASHGIKCYAAGRQSSFVSASRWFNWAPAARKGACPDGDLAGYLKSLPFERLVIMPCSDGWTRALSALPADSRSNYRFSLPDEGVVKKLMDKASLAELLVSLGLPHPSTLVLSKESDLDAVAKDRISNSFLKPTDSEKFFKTFKVKAFRLKSYEDALEKYERVSSLGMDAVYQEYIPGPASNHYFIDGFVDRHGLCRASFARHRLRMYPPDFGNSSFVVSVPISEVQAAHDSLMNLLEKTSYRGIFSAEFKLDPRDNEFKLLEINVRPWWYIWFAEICRVPVALMAYQDALDRDVETVTEYRTGHGLVYPYYDLFAGLEMVRSGQLSMRSWIGSWITAKKANLSLKDPMPSLVGTAKRLMWSIKNRLGMSDESVESHDQVRL